MTHPQSRRRTLSQKDCRLVPPLVENARVIAGSSVRSNGPVDSPSATHHKRERRAITITGDIVTPWLKRVVYKERAFATEENFEHKVEVVLGNTVGESEAPELSLTVVGVVEMDVTSSGSI